MRSKAAAGNRVLRRKKEKAGRYVRLFHVIKRSLFSVFKIKAAFFVIHNRMTDQDADNGGDRNGDHQSEEAEQNPAGEQGEHNPDRMQPDVVADQFRSEEVAFEKLSDHKDGGHAYNRHQAVKLGKGQRHADDEAGDGADIRDKGNDPGQKTDQQAQVQPCQVQADGVKAAEDDAYAQLSADEAGQCAVDFPCLLFNRLF